MTLVVLGFAPLLVLVGAARMVVFKAHLAKSKSNFAEAGKVKWFLIISSFKSYLIATTSLL